MMNRTKYFKVIPLMLLTVFLLSGCVSLQDLRENHATFTDASKKEILWQGKTYLYLTDSSVSNFSPEYEQGYINLTEKEVPVLLAGIEGEYAEASKDGVFITSYGSVYCLEEEYEEMKALIENPPELNCLAYQYYENDDYSTLHFEILDVDTSEKLEDVWKSSTVKSKTEDYTMVAEVLQSSEDGYFKISDEKYLCMNSKGQYFLEVYEEEEFQLYEIPQEYNQILEKVFEDAIRIAEENMMYVLDDEYEEYESY